jgi:hypothetical protein
VPAGTVSRGGSFRASGSDRELVVTGSGCTWAGSATTTVPIEHWTGNDMVMLMQQRGLIPAMAGAPVG